VTIVDEGELRPRRHITGKEGKRPGHCTRTVETHSHVLRKLQGQGETGKNLARGVSPWGEERTWPVNNGRRAEGNNEGRLRLIGQKNRQKKKEPALSHNNRPQHRKRGTEPINEP